MHGFFHIVRPTTNNNIPAKNAVKSPPMKPNQFKADELPDDLRWDFLRELVEEEFAKLEPMIANEQMAQKHHAQKLSLACQNLQNLDVLSAASTANNSPAGRPIQPSTEAPPLVGEKGGETPCSPLEPKLREPTVIMHRVRYPSTVMSSHCSEYMITLPGHEMQALL
jgi:hypothetical protein